MTMKTINDIVVEYFSYGMLFEGWMLYSFK